MKVTKRKSENHGKYYDFLASNYAELYFRYEFEPLDNSVRLSTSIQDLEESCYWNAGSLRELRKVLKKVIKKLEKADRKDAE